MRVKFSTTPAHSVFRRNSTNVELNQPLNTGLNYLQLTATLLTSIIPIVGIYMLSIKFAYLLCIRAFSFISLSLDLNFDRQLMKEPDFISATIHRRDRRKRLR